MEALRVVITEQPGNTRFRYKSENKTRGKCRTEIRGINYGHKKSYPTIKISGYIGKVRVAASCVMHDNWEKQHPIQLEGKDCWDNGVWCTNWLEIREELTVTLTEIGIQCPINTPKEISKCLEARKKIFPNIGPGFKFLQEEKSKSYNLNAVKLRFYVSIYDDSEQILWSLSEVSEIIYDLRKFPVIKGIYGPIQGSNLYVLLCNNVQGKDQFSIFSKKGHEHTERIHEIILNFKNSTFFFKLPTNCLLSNVEKGLNFFIELTRDGLTMKSEPYTFKYTPTNKGVVPMRDALLLHSAEKITFQTAGNDTAGPSIQGHHGQDVEQPGLLIATHAHGTESNLEASAMQAPRVVTTEQPRNTRFRYKSENKTRGKCRTEIRGINYGLKKCYPTIKISGYIGKVRVAASCVMHDNWEKQHPIQLEGKDCCDNGVWCSNWLEIRDELTVTLTDIGIQCPINTHEEISKCLQARREIFPYIGAGFKFLQEEKSKSYNLNAVKLRFYISIFDDSGQKQWSLSEVSEIICDLRKFPVIKGIYGPILGSNVYVLLCDNVQGKDQFRIFSKKGHEHTETIYEIIHNFKNSAFFFELPLNCLHSNVDKGLNFFIELNRDGLTMKSEPYTFECTSTNKGVETMRDALLLHSAEKITFQTAGNDTAGPSIQGYHGQDVEQPGLLIATHAHGTEMPPKKRAKIAGNDTAGPSIQGLHWQDLEQPGLVIDGTEQQGFVNVVGHSNQYNHGQDGELPEDISEQQGYQYNHGQDEGIPADVIEMVFDYEGPRQMDVVVDEHESDRTSFL